MFVYSPFDELLSTGFLGICYFTIYRLKISLASPTFALFYTHIHTCILKIIIIIIYQTLNIMIWLFFSLFLSLHFTYICDWMLQYGYGGVRTPAILFLVNLILSLWAKKILFDETRKKRLNGISSTAMMIVQASCILIYGKN